MIQTIIVVLLFVAAIAYIGKMIYNHFTMKENCATGCGKCNAVDFSKIEKQLKEKGV
jgi:hypothetical protein